MTRSRATARGAPGNGPPTPTPKPTPKPTPRPTPKRRPPTPPAASTPGASDAPARRRRGLRRLAVLLAVVVAVVGLGYVLLFSRVLAAGTVEVVGTGLLTPDEVRTAAAIPAGQPLLRLNTDAVAGRVRQLPPVLDVDVRRSWPTTVVITVTERVPLAYVPAPTGARLVDASGLAYATVSATPPNLPKLTATEPDAAGAAASVLAILAEPRREPLWAELVEVSADHPADIRLHLRGNRAVHWGSADASARKADVLVALLTQPGKVYDVASPDLPTIR